MRRRWRSPSLFLTFAGAFLGVLILGTVLQGFVLVRLVGSIREHLDRSNAEALVEQVAREASAALTQAPGADVARILDAYPTRPDSFLLVYRAAEGDIILPRRIGRRFGFAMRVLLAANPDLKLGPLAPPFEPPDGPRRGEAPPPRRRAPERFGPGGPRRGFGEPRLVAVAAVPVGGATLGHVLAVRRGPPPGAFPALGRDPRALLLFLPLAILLAGGAGLLMFRSLLGRLRQLETLTTRVAAGDLDVGIPDPGADEIGRLGAALNRMTRSLAQAQSAVDETHHQRRRLFADISHELATPLTSIHGYTETLLNRDVRVSSAERDTYLRHILDASTRMGLLLDDLLELTRLESGTIQLTRERLNWTTLCLHTLERFGPRFRAAGLELD